MLDLFRQQLGSFQGRSHQIQEIQVWDLEVDHEDIPKWFMHSAFSHSALPNLKQAVLYMDGLEGYQIDPKHRRDDCVS